MYQTKDSWVVNLIMRGGVCEQKSSVISTQTKLDNRSQDCIILWCIGTRPVHRWWAFPKSIVSSLSIEFGDFFSCSVPRLDIFHRSPRAQLLHHAVPILATCLSAAVALTNAVTKVDQPLGNNLWIIKYIMINHDKSTSPNNSWSNQQTLQYLQLGVWHVCLGISFSWCSLHGSSYQSPGMRTKYRHLAVVEKSYDPRPDREASGFVQRCVTVLNRRTP